MRPTLPWLHNNPYAQYQTNVKLTPWMPESESAAAHPCQRGEPCACGGKCGGPKTAAGPALEVPKSDQQQRAEALARLADDPWLAALMGLVGGDSAAGPVPHGLGDKRNPKVKKPCPRGYCGPAPDGSGWWCACDDPNALCIRHWWCTPNCATASCGPDGCGGSCGTCPPPQTCQNGSCVEPEIVPPPPCTLPDSGLGGPCTDAGCPVCAYAYSCINGKCGCSPDLSVELQPGKKSVAFHKCSPNPLGKCQCPPGESCGTRWCLIYTGSWKGKGAPTMWASLSADQVVANKLNNNFVNGSPDNSCVCGCGTSLPDGPPCGP